MIPTVFWIAQFRLSSMFLIQQVEYIILRLCLFFHIGIEESCSALSAVVTIMMLGHEATNTGSWTVFTKSDYLSTIFDTVIFQGLERNSLTWAFHLFGFWIYFFLSLLSSSTKTQHKVKCTFLLNIVVRECSSVFKLLSSENQTLLIWGDSFLVLNLCLNIVDGVRRLYIKRDGLTCQCDNKIVASQVDTTRDASQPNDDQGNVNSGRSNRKNVMWQEEQKKLA